LLAAIVGLLLPAGWLLYGSARAQLRRAATANRLQHIRMALDLYHAKYGSYPPQYLVDDRGRAAHSWRVLLLEFSYPDLYRRYRFDEPWNGPHNRLLESEMPEDYRSPFVSAKSTITQYVGIAGEGTPWYGTTRLRDRHAAGGNRVVWFVEAANSDIHWMEPRDIPLEQALAGVNVAGGGGIQSNYPEGIPAEMLPLECDFVPAGISAEDLFSILTGRGRETPEQSSTGATRARTPATHE
jgi:hypothetical protein